MEEIICINGAFQPDVLAFYKQFGVETPQEGKLYTIREIRKNTVDEQIGLLLEEIKNPKVPVVHPVLGVQKFEPSWAYTRFATLYGEPLTKAMVEEMKQQHAEQTRSNRVNLDDLF